LSRSTSLKVVGVFVLEFFAIVVAPGIAESCLPRLRPLFSWQAIVLKEWFVSIFLPVVLGFVCYRTWHLKTSKWIWIPAALWFAFHAESYATSHTSVLLHSSGGWAHFSGADCPGDQSSCHAFLGETVPLIRTLSYSAAAVLTSLMPKRPAPPASVKTARIVSDDNPKTN
jgi:hypothetical protein